MNTPSSSHVIFFSVTSNAQKISRLIDICSSCFAAKESLMIFVEDVTAESFVDQLLWDHPCTSFLPHVVSTTPVQAHLVIAREKKNLNHAKQAFNLCSTPLLLPEQFRTIYDFEDATHPLKTRLFQLRFEEYKKNHFTIESRVPENS